MVGQDVTGPVAGWAGPVCGVDWHAQPDLDGDDELLSKEVETQGWDGGAVEPLACMGERHRGQSGHLAFASSLREVR